MFYNTAIIITIMTIMMPPNNHQPIAIPTKYGFPVDSAKLERLRSTGDINGMRHHAWMLWDAITSNASNGRPIWETWWRASTTFAPASNRADYERANGWFEKSSQLLAAAQQHDKDVHLPIMTRVLFNDVAHKFIRHQRLYDIKVLNALYVKYKGNVLPAERSIPEFPRRSIVLKTVWCIIKHDEVTQMPIWNADVKEAKSYPPEEWNDNIYIIPRADLLDREKHHDAVLLDKFYYITLNTIELVNSAKNALRDASDDNEMPRLGDHAVLVAMHVTTKEIDDWVWATYWWHHKPNDGLFGNDRPASIKRPWNNYLMDVTLDDVIPMDHADEAPWKVRKELGEFEPRARLAEKGIVIYPNSCFNPWLEAGLDRGIFSNCMSCHRRARWVPSNRASSLNENMVTPLGRISNTHDIKDGAGALRLDFIWSLARRRMINRTVDHAINSYRGNQKKSRSSPKDANVNEALGSNGD